MKKTTDPTLDALRGALQEVAPLDGDPSTWTPEACIARVRSLKPASADKAADAVALRKLYGPIVEATLAKAVEDIKRNGSAESAADRISALIARGGLSKAAGQEVLLALAADEIRKSY